MLRLKAFSIILHIAGWLLFLMLPLLFMHSGQEICWYGILYSLPFLCFCLCYISIFYINFCYFIPDYFIRKKYTVYFLCIALLFAGVFYLRPFDRLMNSRIIISASKCAEYHPGIIKEISFTGQATNFTGRAEADFAPLSSELICISNFIDLQKLRLGKMVTLNYSIEGEPADYQICPLLLMTFIENVFKYGLSNHIPALIVISIRIQKGSIIFHSQNTIFDSKRHTERTGIGIANTRKRLEHLYPGTHTLAIDQSERLFTVDLVLRY